MEKSTNQHQFPIFSAEFIVQNEKKRRVVTESDKYDWL